MSDKRHSSQKANLPYRIQTRRARLNKQADYVLKSCFSTTPEFGKAKSWVTWIGLFLVRHHQLEDRGLGWVEEVVIMAQSSRNLTCS